MTSPRTIRKADRGRRPDIETELSDHFHVTWGYLTNVPTSHFDIDRSLHNQARFEPIDEATVEQYQEGVERGDPFPAVIAYRVGRGGSGKLVIIDGNHRLVAHDRAGQPIAVYEVDHSTKAQTIALMTYAFNTRHGRPTSEEERITSALYLIDNGASVPAAAAAVNVGENVLKRALARQKADQRAKDVGLDLREWDALAQSTKGRLLNISTDEGFSDAVHLAYAAKLNSDEAFELVQLLNSSKSATKQRNLIKSERDRFSDRIHSNAAGVLGTADRRGMAPKSRVGIAVGMIIALPDDLDAIARAWADAERDEAAERINAASETLAKLAAAITAR